MDDLAGAFAQLMAKTALSVHTMDADGTFTYVNEGMADALGYAPENLVGRSLSEFMTAAVPLEVLAFIKGRLATAPSLSMSATFTARDGSTLDGEEHLVAEYDETGAVCAIAGLFVDFARRDERSRTFQSASDRFRQVAEQSPSVYELYDSDGLQVEVNAAYETLWGFDRSRTVGTFNVLDSQEVVDTGLLEYVQRAFAGERVQIPPYRFDPRGVTESGGHGRVRWLSTRIYPLLDEADGVTHIVIMHEDVTDTCQARQALLESEEKFRDVFENSLDSICILDTDKNYLEVNKATETLTGYSREELLTMSVADMVHPDDRDHSQRHLDELDSSGFYNTYEGRILTKSGQTRYVEVNSNVIERDGVVVGSRDFLRDVTERKMAEEAQRRLEQQLYVSQKMESVGRLAGGIAHDFNNILASVMGYSELLRESFPDEDTLEGEASAVILKGAERASHLTKQLLGFARRGKYNPVPLDLNEVIREVVAMSAKIFEERIRVTFDLAPTLPPVEADKSQVDQVLTNLIINARDAMADGGDLLVCTEHVTTLDSALELEPCTGGYVRIAISDSGSGMSEEVCAQIFEPFFSTKREGEGTGLGLATVYGIVRNHKGAVDVHSEVGVGTTFTILLPSANGTVAPSEREAHAISGRGVVLVIDDEPGVRRVTARQLESLGYSALQAADGAQGVAKYRAEAGAIDLVLVDMVMPGMDGAATFAALKKIDPQVRAVLTSGFSSNGRASEILDAGVVGFLQKPFRRTALSAIVSEALA